LKLNIGTIALAVLVVGVSLLRHPWVGPWTLWQIAGLAIGSSAFALLLLARIQLGRAFSVRAKATNLVTHGLYARIRHPIYVFGGLTIVGAVIFVQRPWWLLIFLVLVPLQLIRVRNEEQVLEATFGNDYRKYRQRTWF
jgi:protein-S-isoprenylcysteine O-methyltransferase Ste14